VSKALVNTNNIRIRADVSCEPNNCGGANPTHVRFERFTDATASDRVFNSIELIPTYDFPSTGGSFNVQNIISGTVIWLRATPTRNGVDGISRDIALRIVN